MNDVTLPGLVVPIEARIDKLERALKKASQTQSKFARDMEARAKRSADRMAATYTGLGAKMAGAFKSIPLPGVGMGIAGLAGAGIGAALGTAAGQIRETVKGIAEIGNEARRAGVDAEAFQRWSYVATQNRISIDALTDGFKELSLRADEFVTTGSGSGADAFKRLGFSATDLAKRLKDPSALMLEIIKRLEGFDKAAQIRIADEVFGGTGGERFVEMLGRGEAGISNMMNKASVLTEEQIAKADQLDRRYAALADSIHRGWQRAALGVADFVAQVLNAQIETDKLAASDLFRNRAQAPQILGPNVNGALEGNGQSVADNAQAIGDLLSLYERFASQADTLAPILTRFGGELRRMGDTGAGEALEDAALSMQTLSDQLDRGEISAGDFEKRMAELIRKAQDALASVNEIDDNPRFSKVIERLGGLWDALEALRQKAREAREALPGGSLPMTTGTGLTAAEIELPPGQYAPEASPRPKAAPAMISENVGSGSGKGGGGGAGGRSHDSYAAAVADLEREKAALDAEAVALVAAAAAGSDYAVALDAAHAKAKLLAAAQAEGKQITPELTAQIDAMAQSYAQAGSEAERAAAKLRKADEAGKAGARSLADVFGAVATGAMTAEEALAQLLAQIAQAQLNKMFVGMFGGTDLAVGLGGLLGFANGGYTGDGGKFQPAGIVHKGEYVLSKAAVQRLGVDALDTLHTRALRGYSGGGLVGDAPAINRGTLGRSGSPAQAVTINAPVTVNATGGTPAQNADLAAQMAEQAERMFRALVQKELVNQMRPGGMLR
ncbi:hypothetical protein DFO80_12019 [Rhodobacter sp. 140A]|nr:hypothetical protein DFO80_12019 [Rhodobacter sp. 140A]